MKKTLLTLLAFVSLSLQAQAGDGGTFKMDDTKLRESLQLFNLIEAAVDMNASAAIDRCEADLNMSSEEKASIDQANDQRCGDLADILEMQDTLSRDSNGQLISLTEAGKVRVQQNFDCNLQGHKAAISNAMSRLRISADSPLAQNCSMIR